MKTNKKQHVLKWESDALPNQNKINRIDINKGLISFNISGNIEFVRRV